MNLCFHDRIYYKDNKFDNTIEAYIASPITTKLGGKKYRIKVLPSKQWELEKIHESVSATNCKEFLLTTLKVLSYLTLIFPLIAICLRYRKRNELKKNLVKPCNDKGTDSLPSKRLGTVETPLDLSDLSKNNELQTNRLGSVETSLNLKTTNLSKNYELPTKRLGLLEAPKGFKASQVNQDLLGVIFSFLNQREQKVCLRVNRSWKREGVLHITRLNHKLVSTFLKNLIAYSKEKSLSLSELEQISLAHLKSCTGFRQLTRETILIRDTIASKIVSFCEEITKKNLATRSIEGILPDLELSIQSKQKEQAIGFSHFFDQVKVLFRINYDLDALVAEYRSIKLLIKDLLSWNNIETSLKILRTYNNDMQERRWAILLVVDYLFLTQGKERVLNFAKEFPEGSEDNDRIQARVAIALYKEGQKEEAHKLCELIVNLKAVVLSEFKKIAKNKKDFNEYLNFVLAEEDAYEKVSCYSDLSLMLPVSPNQIQIKALEEIASHYLSILDGKSYSLCWNVDQFGCFLKIAQFLEKHNSKVIQHLLGKIIIDDQAFDYPKLTLYHFLRSNNKLPLLKNLLMKELAYEWRKKTLNYIAKNIDVDLGIVFLKMHYPLNRDLMIKKANGFIDDFWEKGKKAEAEQIKKAMDEIIRTKS